MVSTSAIVQSFFYKENPVDPIESWKMFINDTPPVADVNNITWPEYQAIAKQLRSAGVGEWLLGIGVTAEEPVVVDRYDRTYDPEGKNCVYGTYQPSSI